MSKPIFVVPTLGEPLPFPGGVLPVTGDYIDPDETFWRRRLADQDVKKTTPAKAAAAADAAAPDAPAADPAAPATPKK